MKAYPAYKESGVEWVGEIPADWGCVKLKYKAVVQTSNIDKKEHENAVKVKIIHYNDVVKNKYIFNDYEFDYGYCSEAQFQTFKLRKGDIVITKDSMDVRNIADICLVQSELNDVVYGYHLSKISIYDSSVISKYLFYYFSQSQVKDYFLIHSTGVTIIGLGKTTIENIRIVFPSLPEQQAIADFLDRKTVQIDKLIEKKQRQIDLLQEQRTALINHAVTKGLNTNVPMKNSGVEWLGEIPSHWFVVPMRRMLDVRDGTHDTPDYVESNDKSVPFVTSKDFDGDAINFETAKRISLDDHQNFIKRSKVDKGDVLMSMIGGNIGKALIVSDVFDFSIKNVALFKTYGDEALSKYILYYIRSGLLDIQIEIQSRGGAQSFLSLTDIRNLIFFKMPKQEYASITKFLDERTNDIERQIRMIQREINLIQEYRTALISEAVTGKIDVRETVHE